MFERFIAAIPARGGGPLHTGRERLGLAIVSRSRLPTRRVRGATTRRVGGGMELVLVPRGSRGQGFGEAQAAFLQMATSAQAYQSAQVWLGVDPAGVGVR